MAKNENLAIELRKKIAENKIVLGTQAVKRKLLNKFLKKIIIAKNYSEELKEEFEKHCKMAGVDLEIVKFNSEELGILCKKQFPVSIIGVLR